MFLYSCLIILTNCSAKNNTHTGNPQNNQSQNTTGAKTYAFIIGTLEWSDPNLHSFEKKNRKDQELYELLKNTGVNEENAVFLMDQKATLSNIKEKMSSLLSKSEKGSHFIFYYAGHGMHDNGRYYFANYDISTNDPASTGLDLDIIGNIIVKNFKGERVTLWADCCYSGGLSEVAETLSKKGFKTCALTSSTNTNTSTGNWTYSQAIIDGLRGDGIMDRNSDGKISLNEMGAEVRDAMKFRERQLNSYVVYNLDGDQTVFSEVRSKINRNNPLTGNYVFATYNGKWEIARIKGVNNDQYDCEFYFYSDKQVQQLPKEKIRPPHFISYKTGEKINVEYEGKWYNATIEKQDGDFYFITYNDYDHSYDEWVLYDRIRTGNEKKVEVLWEGKYYTADLLETKNDKSYVHYDGYDYTWDEWTDSKNIK